MNMNKKAAILGISPKYNERDKELANIAFNKAQEIYGASIPSRISTRIYEELNLIVDKGLTDTFLNLYEGLKNADKDGKLRFNKGFRGPVGSSFMAFLLEITSFNPMEAGEENFKAKMFFEKDNPIIDLNLPAGRRIHINDPKVKIHNSINVELLYALQMKTNDNYYYCMDTKSEMIEDFFARCMQDENYKDLCPIAGEDLLAVLPEFKNFSARGILKSVYDKNGRIDLDNLARIIGLMHGEGTWNFNAEGYYLNYYNINDIKDRPVAFVEDVYDLLTDSDISREDIDSIAEKVIHGKYTINENEKSYMYHHNISYFQTENLAKIKHLFYKSQCYQYAIETARLIYYYCKYPELYLETYKKLQAQISRGFN